MTIKKAVERLMWRFSEGKPFKPNEADIDSFNEIVMWINDAKKSSIESNQGFAKLFTAVYLWQLEKYQASPLDDFVQVQLNKMLEKPLSYYFDRATEKLNDIEQNIFLQEIAAPFDKHPALVTDEEKEKVVKRAIEKLANDSEEMKRLTGQVWEREDVESNLKGMISEALIRFKL